MEGPVSEEVAAATTFIPYRSSYGTRSTLPVPPGRAKITTPPVPEPRFPTPPDFRLPAPTNVSSTSVYCRRHNIIACEECFLLPTPRHRFQALVAVCQDCGQQHPVIADACQSDCKDTNMTLADGMLENQPV